MLNKILLFLACFFGCTTMVIGFLYNLQSGRIDSLETSNTSLRANNNLLIKKLEKEHNDKYVELEREPITCIDSMKTPKDILNCLNEYATRY